jgi:N-acyl-L-homoserine lactone synthetase
MTGSALENAVLALREEASIEVADTDALRLEAYRLRYQVYCVERGFEPGQNGIESDEYDKSASHAILRWRHTGVVVGTVRLVLPRNPLGKGDNFPLQHVCDPALLRGLPLATTGEVSRFALAKQMRSSSPSCSSLLRLALIQGAVRLSAEAGHTHWLAVMEPTLLRLLGATGVHFTPLGGLVDYHGMRQPAVAELVPTLARLAKEQPVVWDFVTQGGKWYPTSQPSGVRIAHSARVVAPVPQWTGFGASVTARNVVERREVVSAHAMAD